MCKKILAISFVLAFSMITMSVCVNVARAAVTEEGLVLYYSFEGNTIKGETVEDVIGENHGILVGDPETVAGKVGDGLEFDGVGDIVQLPVIMLGDFTIETWYFVSMDPPEWSRIFDGGRGDCGDLYICPKIGLTGGDLGLSLYSILCVDAAVGSGIFVEEGEWYHVVVTHDKDGEGLKFYVNGELNGTHEHNVDSFEDWAEAEQEWFIAGSNWANAPLPGIMDEFRLYNRALDENEVKEHMSGIFAVTPHESLSAVWGGIKSE